VGKAGIFSTAKLENVKIAVYKMDDTICKPEYTIRELALGFCFKLP